MIGQFKTSGDFTGFCDSLLRDKISRKENLVFLSYLFPAHLCAHKTE
jgi:hypothetical protein